MKATAKGRTPVLVGVAQLLQREDDFELAAEPLELMRRACRMAGEDSGAPDALALADAVYVIRGAWPYDDPARLIADELGASSARSVGTSFGGNMVQTCIDHAARAIAAGELEIALLTGAECGRTRAQRRRAGLGSGWSRVPGEPDLVLGKIDNMIHPAELDAGLAEPVHMYALFENALRHARGESLAAHRRRIAELWARMSAVAADNPHAWIRERLGPDEIATPSADNRMIAFPYPKRMVANSRVDMGGALLLCSLERAEALGVAADRFVFLHAACEAQDTDNVSHRHDLHSSPAIRITGRRALELAGVDAGELAHVDLYSCFPSAVQVAAAELGLPEDRPLSVTGGLTFGGGPLNDYVMHSVARMAELLRAEPGRRGLVTANGGYLTKHAIAVYSSDLPEEGFRFANVQAEVDRHPTRGLAEDWSGAVHIESYTVSYDDEGAAHVHAACLLDDGRRCWAKSADRALAEAMTQEEFCGRPARVDDLGHLQLD